MSDASDSAVDAPAGKLLTAADLSRRLDLPLSWVRKQTDEGTIPCLRLGQRTRYSASEVESTLRAMASQSRPRERTRRDRKPRAVPAKSA